MDTIMDRRTITQYAHRGIFFSVPNETETFLKRFGQASFDMYKERYPITEQTKYWTNARLSAEFGEFAYEVVEYEEQSIYDIDALSPIVKAPRIERKPIKADWWRYDGRDYQLAYIVELDVVVSV